MVFFPNKFLLQNFFFLQEEPEKKMFNINCYNFDLVEMHCVVFFFFSSDSHLNNRMKLYYIRAFIRDEMKN